MIQVRKGEMTLINKSLSVLKMRTVLSLLVLKADLKYVSEKMYWPYFERTVNSLIWFVMVPE